MKIAVGITGSSGSIYAVEFLKNCPAEKFLVITQWGKAVLKDELNLSDSDLQPYIKKQFSNEDLTAPLASGTNKLDAVVILPCSISTIGKIASGIGDTLLTRMAAVALKERFKMILCVRETPLSTITLEQCTKLSRDGVIIMPISPPTYFHPQNIDEFIKAFIGKLNSVLGIEGSKGWRSGDME